MIQHEKVAKSAEGGSSRTRPIVAKRGSDTSSNRLPPAPSGGIVRQPIGGSRVSGAPKGSGDKKKYVIVMDCHWTSSYRKKKKKKQQKKTRIRGSSANTLIKR